MRVAIDALALRAPFVGVQRALTGLLKAFNALALSNDEALSKEDSFIVVAGRGAPLPELCDRFTVLRTWFRAENRTLRLLYQQLFLHRRVFKAGADVFHAPAYVAPRLAYLPVVLTIHDLFAFDFPALLPWSNVKHFRGFVPASVRLARRVVVPSAYTQDRLLHQFPEAGAKVEVVPFGAGEEFFSEKVRKWPRDERPLPKKYILYVGALEPKKNVETLIKAHFAVALSKKLPIDLVIAGPDAGAEKLLRRTAEGLGFADRVHFIGLVEDNLLPALYRGAEVFVFPSVAEGFGFPVLEAMASGVPVIASNIPALREVGGDTIRYFVPGNVASLREALEEMLLRAKAAKKTIKQARERAEGYSWKKTAQAMLRIYREAIQ